VTTTLAELNRAGRLVTEYARVPQLLRGLTADDLGRAGRLLAALDVDAVRAAHPEVPEVRVAVTGHGTIAGLVPVLTAELARHELLLRPYVTGFGTWLAELLDPGSALYASRPDLVLCVLDPMVVAEELPLPWRPEDVERVLAEKIDLLDAVAGTARSAVGTLVLNTLPLPHQLTAQLVDHRSRARLGAVWREANARLLRLGEAHPGLVVIDLDPLLAKGIRASEARLATYAKAYLSPELLAAYAHEAGHLVRHVTGRTRKCLVLDLDETLWDGVLGDDGADGVRVGVDAGYKAAAFHEFQRVVKQIGSQGVLLAAVSKNDDEPVRRVLAEHPGMVLREADFVHITANWEPKHGNLAALAGLLNLGVDAFVFADDSPFERGLVRRELPAVAVVDLDDEPALHVERLLADGWFDVRELTAEDRARPQLYRAEAARGDLARRLGSLEDYLNDLGVTVTLAPLREADLARVSQLTLRTNQFNLTTERLTLEQVRDWAADGGSMVLTIRAADRFGDSGLVGALFLRQDEDVVSIGNFLLSCRVFGRGIEEACLAEVLRHARESGANAVVGSFRASARNGKVTGLYPRNGFIEEPTGAGSPQLFRHTLTDLAPPPGHLRINATFERTPFHDHA
jgi:FkbH-like protein